jgi:DNA repair protein RecO (recombination protein O)
MRDPRVLVPLHGLHSHPVKGAVSMFIAEVLNAVLRESQSDNATFAFLVDAITRFDVMTDGIANYHLCFLYRLGRFIGIEPDISSYQKGAVFDMQEGRFRMTPPLHHKYLNADDAAVLAMLSRITFDNMRFYKFNRNQRNDMLDKILEYYTIHYSSLSQTQSLDVLRALWV